MKLKFRTFFINTVVFSGIILFASSAFAQTHLVSPTPGVGSLGEFIDTILGIVIRVMIPVLTVFIIYAGFLFVSANGDEKKITTARQTFYWSFVGGAILLGSVLIARLIGGTIALVAS